jgi:hypothetical protein
MTLPTSDKFKYNISAFPCFFKDINIKKTYCRIMTRRFYKQLRNNEQVTEFDILDDTTGLTFGEMALFILHTKNKKRIYNYRNKR